MTLRWTIARNSSSKLSADVLFPSWGRGSLTAVLQDNRVVAVDGVTPVALADVRYFVVLGSEGGYLLAPRQWPPDALAKVKNPSPQASNPRPGTSLCVRLANRSRWRRLGFSAMLAPVRDASHAASVAASLGV